MAVNINSLLRILLNDRLGLSEYGLHYLYPDILTMLKENTLPIFSQYFPCIRNYTFRPRDHKSSTDYFYFLNIPEIVENKLNIISVANVQPKSGIEGVNLMDGSRSFGTSIEDVIASSMSSNIASRGGYSYKNYKFIPPNQIKLRGFGEGDLFLSLKITYPTFSAIPESVMEQFLDLAQADIKIFIYNKLKHYENITMPMGQIDLKLANFENGVTERQEIIERFNNKGYPNKSMSRYYTYE